MTDREKEHMLILRRVRYEWRMIEARAYMLGGGIVLLCFLILFIIASFFLEKWEKVLQAPSALRIFVFGWIALVVGLVYLVSGLVSYRNSAFSIAFFCDTPETAFDDVPGFFWKPKYWKLWKIEQWNNYLKGIQHANIQGASHREDSHTSN
jgi:hypothetical protein